MEHQLWKAIVALLRDLLKRPTPTRLDFSDQRIVEVYYWSAVCDRPTSWACQGKEIKIATDGGKATLNGVNVIKTDILCKNGVIHVIDAVLLPPEEK